MSDTLDRQPIPVGVVSSPLRARALGAERRGNLARAAMRLARSGDLADAQLRADSLVDALAPVLAIPERELAPWKRAVGELVAPAAADRFGPEARTLVDLQLIVTEANRPDPVDFVEWVRTGGRRAVVRPLPVLRDLLRVRRLERAFLHGRAAPSPALSRFGELAEARFRPLRDAFRRSTHAVVLAELDRAGFVPSDPAEEASRAKLADELVDELLHRGSSDFGSLRDHIARGQTKLPDLDGLTTLLRGDALLRLDTALADALDGVHHRGEAYLRWLHSLQSVVFGTTVGRLLWRFLLAPYGVAVLTVFFVDYVVEHLVELLPGLHAVVPLIITWQSLVGLGTAILVVANVGPVRRALGAIVVRAWEAIAVPRSAPLPLPDAPLVRTGRRLGGNASGVAQVWTDVTRTVSGAVFRVDEWLRFRLGAGRSMRTALGVAALAWFLFAYLFRFAFRLVIEPTINPIKHFPVVTVAGKLVIASGLPIMVSSSLIPLVGQVWALALATALCIFTIPGFFGFLAWELRWNWKLYRANRARTLEPVSVGPHGESMVRLLRPGFYSGVIPSRQRRLLRAIEVSGDDSPAVRRQQHHLKEIRRAIVHFVRRDLLSLLERSRAFAGRAPAVTQVDMRGTVLRVALGWRASSEPSAAATSLVPPAPDAASAPDSHRPPPGSSGDRAGELELELAVEDRRLVARVSHLGFAAALDEDRRQVLEAATLGFLAAAGVRQVVGAGPLELRWDEWAAYWQRELAGPPGALVASRTFLAGGPPSDE